MSKRFIETIGDREVLVKEIEEHVGYLSYDINPIGPPTKSMLDASVKNTLEEIKTIKDKLDKLADSINESLKNE